MRVAFTALTDTMYVDFVLLLLHSVWTMLTRSYARKLGYMSQL